MKKFVLALSILTLCSLSFAGTPAATQPDTQREAMAALAQKSAAQAARHSPLATSTCAFTFTSGSANTFLKYCVTVNGNITQLETPQGHEHIAVGSFGEGYGLCDFTSFIGYSDYADFGDSGNWGSSTVTSQTATSVKTVRSTSDGIWTLTQVITQVAGTASVKVAMTLKNNTAVTRTVQFMRYADVDIDGVFANNFDGTINSAFGWNSVGSLNAAHAYSLALENVGTTPIENAGIAQVVPGGPDPCNPFANWFPNPQLSVDGSLVHIYTMDVPKNSSKTVTVTYKAI